MFTVLRQTMRKRLQAKLSEVKAELKRHMHDPIPKQGTRKPTLRCAVQFTTAKRQIPIAQTLCVYREDLTGFSLQLI